MTNSLNIGQLSGDLQLLTRTTDDMDGGSNPFGFYMPEFQSSPYDGWIIFSEENDDEGENEEGGDFDFLDAITAFMATLHGPIVVTAPGIVPTPDTDYATRYIFDNHWVRYARVGDEWLDIGGVWTRGNPNNHSDRVQGTETESTQSGSFGIDMPRYGGGEGDFENIDNSNPQGYQYWVPVPDPGF